MEPNKPTQSTPMKPSSSSFSPFKSKKILGSSPKPAPSSDPNTPLKATPTSQFRQRTRSKVLSVSQIRKIAQELNSPSKKIPSNSSSDPIPSTPLKKKKKSLDAIQLPERLETLAKLFDNMVCSIRLLRLKGTMCTFPNICKTMESLTDRRFYYNQLAQMKYILPEAIVLKKELLRDDDTLCMRPHLQVTLEIDAIENDGNLKEGITYSNVGKVFRARLLDFTKIHPEVDEVPEDTLPEPFNQTKEQGLTNINQPSIPSLSLEASITHNQQSPVVASHLSRSFQKRFVQKVPVSASQKTPLLLATKEDRKENDLTVETTSVLPSPIKHSSIPPNSRRKSLFGASIVGLPPSTPSKIDDEMTKPEKNKEFLPKENTPSKGTRPASTPARVMTMTPDLQTPKRCHSKDDYDSIASPNKLVTRPPRNRPLFQTPVKSAKAEDEIIEMGSTSVDSDLIKLLPKSLVQSLREKEKRANEGHDIAISQAKRRRMMIAALPKLFNMIRLMFNLDKCNVITKQDLMQRIIAGNVDIVDRAEFEEQLKLLQELVPDWISEKIASSGDHLFCVNRMSCPELICKRLDEAI